MKAFVTFITALSLILIATPAPAGSPGTASPVAERPSLDTIKSLAGDWVEVGEDGKPTDRVISSYAVTAGGSAVIERLFPGSDHEMVTVYHQEKKDLTLTHYCVEGNQPRMRARATSTPARIVFECRGGTNIASEDDRHMHEAVFTFVDPDHLRVEWLQFEKGKNTYTAKFDLARVR